MVSNLLGLTIILLFLNQVRAASRSCSSILIISFELLAKLVNALLSAQLREEAINITQKESLKKTLKSIGPLRILVEPLI